MPLSPCSSPAGLAEPAAYSHTEVTDSTARPASKNTMWPCLPAELAHPPAYIVLCPGLTSQFAPSLNVVTI